MSTASLVFAAAHEILATFEAVEGKGAEVAAARAALREEFAEDFGENVVLAPPSAQPEPTSVLQQKDNSRSLLRHPAPLFDIRTALQHFPKSVSNSPISLIF